MSQKMSAVSFFSLHLELFKNSNKIGDGTGFMYYDERSERNFLITNYHVLTCRDPKEPERLLSGYPDSPDEIQFYSWDESTKYPVSGSFKIDESTQWIEHERRSDGVDIVGLPITFAEDSIVISQKNLDLVDDVQIEAGSDLFIVGFPFGFSAGNFFPIWKRGTIASEPLFKPNGISQFYIDSYTHPGMSGSPVFAIARRNMVTVSREYAEKMEMVRKGEISALDILSNISKAAANPVEKQCLQFVGIYSGRVNLQGNRDPNIGIVWQKSLIDDLFINPIVATHPYPPIAIDA